MSDKLSTDCPARKMARDFIAKFKQDDGVMRSLHKRNVALSEIVRKPKSSVPWIPPAIGRCGRWGSHFLRQKFSECEIGDAVPVASDHPECQFIKIITTPDGGEFPNSTEPEVFLSVGNRVTVFKKVLCCYQDFRGQREIRCFWERIE